MHHSHLGLVQKDLDGEKGHDLRLSRVKANLLRGHPIVGGTAGDLLSNRDIDQAETDLLPSSVMQSYGHPCPKASGRE